MTVRTHGRIVFDITSSARWSGPPAGIVRAERELAQYARRRLPDTVFAVFDSKIMAYRKAAPPFRDAFIDGTATLNTWAMPDPTGRRKRRSAWVPEPVYAALQGRRTLLRMLERVRLTTADPARAGLADRLQRRLMNRRHQRTMLRPDGGRQDFVTRDMALAEPVEFGPADTLLCAGYGWNDTNITAIARLKAERGARVALVCYDTIPLSFPRFFKPRDVGDMRHYWSLAFANADVVVVNSKAVAKDVAAYADASGLGRPRICVRPLGADPADMCAARDATLPAGLETDRYALFVSTIEPRKGHEMLYRVWERLRAEDCDAVSGFRLVFVGRPGWMMEAFEQTLRDEARAGGSVVVLAGVSDATLDLLYRNAAFCLYPSLYEGYGLPVVEAFARGKAVIVSNAGALPETAEGFSPCLDPEDETAWHDMLKTWIRDPAARAPYEAAIRERFRHPGWEAAAAGVFEALSEAVHA